MGLFDFFKRKDTDALNFAHSLSLDAVSVFHQALADLHHAQQVLEDVKATAKADIEEAKASTDAEIERLQEKWRTFAVGHLERHDQAQVVQDQNSRVISNLGALTK